MPSICLQVIHHPHKEYVHVYEEASEARYNKAPTNSFGFC